MSSLLQSLLGAKVDGTGSSFHVDGRRDRGQDDNLPIMWDGRDVYWRSKHGDKGRGGSGGEPGKSWAAGDWRMLLVTI